MSQMDQVGAAPPLTTFEEHIETLHIVPRMERTLQCASQPGSSHMRQSSGRPQSPKRISSLLPGMESVSLQIKYAMLVERERFYHCILPPELLTI